ncbi:MAG: exo-alpha-sialidase [Pirellulales bacterium]|nr:exo-alpha-sialidase [Pirellulales bacterium]
MKRTIGWGGCLLLWIGCLGAHGKLAEAADPRVEPLSPELHARCLQVLREALAGEEFWPAMHAAEALTLAGRGAEVVAALEPRFPQETDDQRRCGLVREMVRTGDRRQLDVLFDILANPGSNGRTHAAESLYKIAELGDGRLLRSAFAQSSDDRLRLMAAAALARGGNRAALAHLRDKLASPDVEIRKVAAWALGLLGDQQDVEPVAALLEREEQPLAKAYAAHALACLGDGRGRAALVANLSSPEVMVRTYAADFAGYGRATEARERLEALLDDPGVDVRVRAAQSLIALSLPPGALGLPVSVVPDDFAVDVYPATAEHPRYSEGSIAALADGSLLYATTEFVGGGADHATATIIGRTSIDGGRTWGEARLLQENVGRQNVMSVTLRRLPKSGDKADIAAALNGSVQAPLGMFYLVKNSHTDLDAYLRVSHDQGQSFGPPVLVTDEPGYHVMNNDRVTVLSSGRILCPVASCDDVSHGGEFRSWVFLSDDGGATWRGGKESVAMPQRGAMEPEVIELSDGRVLMIIRTQFGSIATSYSSDGGDTWSKPEKLSVPSPESPATIRRLPSTGDLLLVWNNVQPPPGAYGRRTPLTAAISSDEGGTWQHLRNLETSTDDTYAYTSVLFHRDGVLLSYYVAKEGTGRISSRFRSLPVSWFYASE